MFKMVVLILLLAMPLASCTQSTDKELGVYCKRLVEAAKSDDFINYNWARVKPIFNRNLTKHTIPYYGKKVSEVKTFSAHEGISWNSVGITDSHHYITMQYRDEYRNEIQKKWEDIKVPPYMIERVYVGIYQARLLYLLKPSSEQNQQMNVDKLDYEVYVECNGRVPVNQEMREEPELLLRIK